MISYGGMLMEPFVAISALIAASVIDQGLYFAISSTADATGGTPGAAAELARTLGFNIWPKYADLSWKPASWSTSAVVVALWGYMLYVGVTDPLGGINQLFPLFGISNRLLAAIALTLCVPLMIRHGKAKWAWCSRPARRSATSPSATTTRRHSTTVSCSHLSRTSTRCSRSSPTRRSTASCRASSRCSP